MRTHTSEISKSEWSHFLDGFSRDHVGWLATVEVFDGEVGAQTEASGLPLAGLSADASTRTIWVALAKRADDHITHTIEHVARVSLEQSDSNPALQIEDDDGARTLVRLTRAQ